LEPIHIWRYGTEYIGRKRRVLVRNSPGRLLKAWRIADERT
jgi:hypothetical protein